MKTSVSVALLLFTISPVNAGSWLTIVQREVRLKKSQPSVYISFERIGQLKSPNPLDDRERVWLRLHNNTKWSIMLQMSAVPSQAYGDASLYYDELTKGEVAFRNQCHVCTLNSLGSGKTLLFSIPRNILKSEGGAIRIRFSYGWENQDDVAGGREAEHYVYFDGAKLPQSAQKTF